MPSLTKSELNLLLQRNPDLEMVGDLGSQHSKAPAAPLAISEHELQTAVITECERLAETHPEYALIFSIPNGGHRHKAVAGKLKAEGLKAGVPDLEWPLQRHGYGALFLELKVGANDLEPSQRAWAKVLAAEGYLCKTIWDDLGEVLGLLEWYRTGPAREHA